MGDINDVKLNLETIEDFVFNQDKIVTYRWLSRELIVHTNTAKQLLYTFALKNADKGLLVTYIICGTTENGGIDISVVNQSNIDIVKSELSSVLSEHVYSVQKSTASISSTDLYLADASSTPSCDNRSAIATRNVETRSFEYVKPASNKPTNSTTESKKNGPVVSDQEKNPKPAKEESTKENAAKTGSKASKVVSPIKNSKKAAEGNIGNFFNKQNLQNAEKKKKDGTVDKNTSDKDPKQVKVVSPVKNLKKSMEGSLSALFSKQNAMNDKKKSELPPKVEEPKQVTPTPREVVEEAPAVEDDDIPKKTAVKTPSRGKKTKSSTSNKKRKTTNDNDNPAKKRKRIVLASDSDSGDDEEMEVTEDPESDPESHRVQEKVSDSEDEVIPPTPYGERIKKRVRKQIDKTYTDDDGFIITEKEFVYETCSDEEDNKQSNRDEKNIDSATPKKSNNNKENIKEQKHVDSKTNNDDHSSKEKLNDSGDKKIVKSDNENESEEVSTKTKGKQGKKSTRGKGRSPKNTSSTNNKQASIMSFFKKM